MKSPTEINLCILSRAQSEGPFSAEINDLATACNTNPDALTECLKALSRQGLIDLFRRVRDGETIKLYDPAFFTDEEFFRTGEFRIRITFDGKLFLEMKARLGHKAS